MTSSKPLEDLKVNIKIKLSALWASVMCCYVYGDFFGLFTPGRIKDLMDGQSGMGTTTPYTLLAYSILMTIPSLMIFGSLVLKPGINRWVNIITGIFFTLIMGLILVTTKSNWMLFYRYFAFVEIVLTGTIVWFSWKWPTSE